MWFCMYGRFRRLIEVSRPVGWIAAPFIIVITVLNFSSPDLSILFFVELFLYSFPFCLFLYGINDIYDRDTDKENNRKTDGSVFLDGSLLNEDLDGFLKKYSFVLVIVLITFPLFRQNLMHLMGVVFLLSFSYLYSAPPFRLKARAPLDSLSNSVIYILGPFLIGFSYTSVSFQWIFVLWMSLAMFAIHASTTIMDYRPDKKAGLKTFAVRFGEVRTVVFSTFLFIILALVPSIFIELRVTSLLLALVTSTMTKEKIRENHAATVFRINVIIIILALFALTAKAQIF